jgi:hypothetical protein
MGTNITPKQSAHRNLVLDKVNHVYLAFSKSTEKPISHSHTILATSYSPASIRVSEKNKCSTAASQNPLTYSHHKSAITFVTHQQSLAVSTVLLLPCEGQVIQPSCLSS